jgi:hypothetical protein
VPGAQPASVLVAVEEGGGLRALARYDGTRWTATCDVPRRRNADSAGVRSPRPVTGENATVDGIRVVAPGSGEWRQLAPDIETVFQRRERQEDVSAAALASAPIRIEAIVTTATASTPQIYFFAASKTIPDSRGDVDADDDGEVDPKGDLRIDVTGWLQRAAAVTPLGTNVTLSWEQVEDRPAAAGTRRSQLIPIGLVRAPGARAWVVQGRAGDIRWYTLYHVGGDGVRMLVRTDARGC